MTKRVLKSDYLKECLYSSQNMPHWLLSGGETLNLERAFSAGFKCGVQYTGNKERDLSEKNIRDTFGTRRFPIGDHGQAIYKAFQNGYRSSKAIQ